MSSESSGRRQVYFSLKLVAVKPDDVSVVRVGHIASCWSEMQ